MPSHWHFHNPFFQCENFIILPSCSYNSLAFCCTQGQYAMIFSISLFISPNKKVLVSSQYFFLKSFISLCGFISHKSTMRVKMSSHIFHIFHTGLKYLCTFLIISLVSCINFHHSSWVSNLYKSIQFFCTFIIWTRFIFKLHFVYLNLGCLFNPY